MLAAVSWLTAIKGWAIQKISLHDSSVYMYILFLRIVDLFASENGGYICESVSSFHKQTRSKGAVNPKINFLLKIVQNK